jgi:hypothetical protein
MGITVNTPYMTNAGFEIPSYYISLGDSQINIVRPLVLFTPTDQPQPAQKYSIEASFNIWVSKQTREENRGKIGGQHVRVISDTPITENVYDVLYNKLKEGLTDYTEDN